MPAYLVRNVATKELFGLFVAGDWFMLLDGVFEAGGNDLDYEAKRFNHRACWWIAATDDDVVAPGSSDFEEWRQRDFEDPDPNEGREHGWGFGDYVYNALEASTGWRMLHEIK